MLVQNPLNNTIGHWIPDSEDMPCFVYTGNVPVTTTLKNGTKVKLPEDLWFILGNYRINVFPPTVFMGILKGEGKISAIPATKGKELSGVFDLKLQPGENRIIELVIGYSFEPSRKSIDETISQMGSDVKEPIGYIERTFIRKWKEKLPLFHFRKS